ncbi:MAG TPA: hypothetical protein VHB21_27735, partial [Minicystis sp.]|nr:hypothetical protein [Minicystis sp.]
MILTAALAGGALPLAACSAADEGAGLGGHHVMTGSGGGSETSGTGYAVGSGAGGGLADASVDVAPNDEDPPPFTGKSYEDECGSDPACDVASGACADMGSGGGNPMPTD